MNFVRNPAMFFRDHLDSLWSIPEEMRQFYNFLVYEFALEGWVRKHIRHAAPGTTTDLSETDNMFYIYRGGLPTQPNQKGYGRDFATLATNFELAVPAWSDPGKMCCPIHDNQNCARWDAKEFCSPRFPVSENHYGVRSTITGACRQADGDDARETLRRMHNEYGQLPTHIIALLRDVQGVYLCATRRSINTWGAASLAPSNVDPDDNERTAVIPARRQDFYENYKNLAPNAIVTRPAGAVAGSMTALTIQQHFEHVVNAFNAHLARTSTLNRGESPAEYQGEDAWGPNGGWQRNRDVIAD